MEDKLTLEELYALHDAMYRKEHRRNKMAAALKGIDLDEGNRDSRFDQIQAEAQAQLNGGKSDQQLTLADIGISIDTEDEVYD